MRYAVYIGRPQEAFSFSSSYATFEEALEMVANIKATSMTLQGVIIQVSFPDQKIDPYADALWPTLTVSESVKLQKQKSKEIAG